MKHPARKVLATPQLADQVRTVFVSDLHLGSKYCHPSALDNLLQSVRFDHLYIVGDFFDDWLISRQARCRGVENMHSVTKTIRGLVDEGVAVHYLLGNHDRSLQSVVEGWGLASVSESSVHTCADGTRLLLTHGDRFDLMQRQFPVTARLAAHLHEMMLCGSELLNQLRRARQTNRRPFGTIATVPFKRMMQRYSRFDAGIGAAIAEAGCDGIIFGHTHAPAIVEDRRGIVGNTGDWLENCSAIVESHSGQLELWQGEPADWQKRTVRRVALVPPQPSPSLPAVTIPLSV